MHALPDGWSRISSSLIYDDPKAAIDWLCKAFGFEVRLIVETPDGSVMHSELVYGDGVIMVSGAKSRPFFRSPTAAGGNTQSIMVIVDDADAHCAQARKHGAEISQELSVSDYGPEYWADRVSRRGRLRRPPLVVRAAHPHRQRELEQGAREDRSQLAQVKFTRNANANETVDVNVTESDLVGYRSGSESRTPTPPRSRP